MFFLFCFIFISSTTVVTFVIDKHVDFLTFSSFLLYFPVSLLEILPIFLLKMPHFIHYTFKTHISANVV